MREDLKMEIVEKLIGTLEEFFEQHKVDNNDMTDLVKTITVDFPFVAYRMITGRKDDIIDFHNITNKLMIQDLLKDRPISDAARDAE